MLALTAVLHLVNNLCFISFYWIEILDINVSVSDPVNKKRIRIQAAKKSGSGSRIQQYYS